MKIASSGAICYDIPEQEDDRVRNEKVYQMSFGTVYPLLLQKAQRKGRTKEEVDNVIRWLTGYSDSELENAISTSVSYEAFFANAPHLHENRHLITGTICGVRIEAIEEPLMREIRYLDKLIDELAKGKPMEKILRTK